MTYPRSNKGGIMRVRLVLSLLVLIAAPVALAQTPEKAVTIAIMDRAINSEDSRLKDRLTGSAKSDFRSEPEFAQYEKELDRLNDLVEIQYQRELTAAESKEFSRLNSGIPYEVYQEFIAENHGQHVAGIAIAGTQHTKLLPVTTVENLTKEHEQKILESVYKARDINNPMDVDPQFLSELPARYYLLKEIRNPLFVAVKAQLDMMKPKFEYLQKQSAQIVNMSFGAGLRESIASGIGEWWASNFVTSPSDEVWTAYIHAAQKYASLHLYSWLMQNQDKLFVMAAGNWTNADGEPNNNDTDPSFPVSVANWYDSANLIVVAATVGRESLAGFSGYGDKTVDVAAPGVHILSYKANGKLIHFTGTSQATPYVSNAAAKVLEANPHMNSLELKRIIVQTVDKKAFLKGKVKSEGIVNPVRAVYAAKQAKKHGIDKAIEMANAAVQDLETGS